MTAPVIAVIRADVRYITVYCCTACGKEQTGSTAGGTFASVEAIKEFLERPPQRSHDMPVGWASHLETGFTCGCNRRTT